MSSSTRPRVVIDTNVVISGFIFGGIPSQVLLFWKRDFFTACVSPELEGEILKKLIYKFKASQQIIEDVGVLLREKAEKYLPRKKVNLLKDKKDNFLLELAEESSADFLVTGDKELLRLKNYKKTKILTPGEFLSLPR